MELLDDGSETSAGLVKEVEASTQGGSFVLRFALMNGVVPRFPAVVNVSPNQLLILHLLPLYYRPQFCGSEGVVHYLTQGRHVGDTQ